MQAKFVRQFLSIETNKNYFLQKRAALTVWYLSSAFRKQKKILSKFEFKNKLSVSSPKMTLLDAATSHDEKNRSMAVLTGR